MARTASTAVENNFVNGWITEATGLNFPESAVTDTDNFSYDSTGLVERRLGMDMESNYASNNVSQTSDSLFTEYLWESVAGSGNRTFFIQQVGGVLYFYQVGLSEALSSNYLFSVLLESYSFVPLPQFRQKPFQFTSGFGRLFVTHPYMDPVSLTYDEDTNQITVAVIKIETRDTAGIPGGPTPRLSSITNPHLYNLYNQGWDNSKVVKFRGSGGTYPSDYDVWWLYKTPDVYGTEIFLVDIAVASGILSQIDRGNSPAPKGSIILDEFNQNRAQYVGGIPNVTSGVNRPSSIAFFAGRVFYAGVQAQDYSSKIYFSQILESVEQAGRCYQQNDPTSQYSSDLLATDGGVIVIPDAATCIKLWVMEGSLLVFCSNGIWQVTGSQGIGFAANDYTVKKLSNQEVLSALSFVNVYGAPIWWSTDGIYGITSDGVSGLKVQSLSDTKIKEYYQDLPATVKAYAKGAFNLRLRVVQWVYRESQGATVSLNQNYNRILNFNLETKAFYPYTINAQFTNLKGVISVQGFGQNEVEEDVTDNAFTPALTTLGEVVTTLVSTSSAISSVFKYPVLYGNDRDNLAFSELKDKGWRDWATLPVTSGGIDSPAYFSSGYKVRGDGQRKFQSNYVVLFTENETPSVLNFQARWDYADSGDTGRWSSRQYVDFTKEGFAYSKRRLKVRGSGLACQYHVSSVPDSPVSLIGWSAWDTTNGNL